MTIEERERILCKDYLDCEDIVKLLGVDKQKAYSIIRAIKRVTDRLCIQGKIHVQDYIEYFKLDTDRYLVNMDRRDVSRR